ncbi:hypothetical protein AX774_g6730, partial [Zancudomyces culisetae]
KSSSVAVPSSRTYSKQKWGDEWRKKIERQKARSKATSRPPTPTSTSSSRAQIQSVQAAVARMIGAAVTPSTPVASTPLSSEKSLTTPTLRSTSKSSSVAVPSSRTYSKQKWGDEWRKKIERRKARSTSKSRPPTSTDVSSSSTNIQSAQTTVGRIPRALVVTGIFTTSVPSSTPPSLPLSSLSSPSATSFYSRVYSREIWGDEWKKRVEKRKRNIMREHNEVQEKKKTEDPMRSKNAKLLEKQTNRKKWGTGWIKKTALGKTTEKLTTRVSETTTFTSVPISSISVQGLETSGARMSKNIPVPSIKTSITVSTLATSSAGTLYSPVRDVGAPMGLVSISKKMALNVSATPTQTTSNISTVSRKSSSVLAAKLHVGVILPPKPTADGSQSNIVSVPIPVKVFVKVICAPNAVTPVITSTETQ